MGHHSVVAHAQPEAGLVAVDGYVHAVVRRVFGRTAACGAGRIIQVIAGPFDSQDRLACPSCTDAITGSEHDALDTG